MKPFLEIPICLQNSEGQEKNSIARFQPSEIEYYYPGFNWGCVVIMKSGSSFLTTLTFEEFDAGLAAYDEATLKRPGKFGNLKLNPKLKLHVTD